MKAYHYRLADAAGTYITDAETEESAQLELQAHFLRPVLEVESISGLLICPSQQQPQDYQEIEAAG